MLMKLSSLQLEAFYSCAQSGSFTVAAERLFITQSALSQRILNLEAELQVSLFIRERQKLQLTEFGEKLLRYCQITESLEQDMLADLQPQKNIKGEIRIAGYSSVGQSLILPRLADLTKVYPDIYLKYQDLELYELEATLRSGEVRYIISDQILTSPNLEHQIIGKESYVLIENKKIHSDFYLDHDEKDTITQKILGTQKIKRRYVGDSYGIIEGVRLGLGKAFIPLHMVEHLKDIRVHKAVKATNPIVLHFFKQSFYSQLHHKTLEFLLKK
jgi:DNA-binding transcriptional LysR family regulator